MKLSQQVAELEEELEAAKRANEVLEGKILFFLDAYFTEINNIDIPGIFIDEFARGLLFSGLKPGSLHGRDNADKIKQKMLEVTR